MYLKRLELQGFKSFPDKIRLDFNKGITAVVGPNGSGKSNIADAIRWVLGEQSAKSLRGGKMEDIIFAGTQNRRPLGFAEVSMLIDNADNKMPIDFSEIKITRRVFRSGESEYAINGTSCRLRDVKEMFMDTGVGREGYSIIGQGRVEEILSARSEDRRYLFEEAAGIVKYKNRRNEAQVHIERQKQNLVRVNDIMDELFLQLEPLEKQAEVAKDFLDKRERLKYLQIHLFISEVTRYEKELEDTLKNGGLVREQIEGEKESHSVIQREIATLKEGNLQAEEEIKALQHEQVEMRSAFEQKENDITLTKEQMSHIQSDIARISGDITKKKETVRQLQEKGRADESNYSALKIEIASKRKLLDQQQVEFDLLHNSMGESERQIEFYNTEIIEKIKAQSQAEGAMGQADLLFNQLKQRKEEILEEKHFNESKLDEKNVRCRALETLLNDLDADIRALKKALMSYADRQQALEQEQKRHYTNLEEINQRISEVVSRRNILQELEKSYEGYYRSVKAVLLKKQRSPEEFAGICGAIGELMQTEKNYETAIEVALGSSVQNIVTKTESCAQKAINYLKRRQEGRATFLPLTAVSPKELGKAKERFLHEPGVVGVAKELISYDAVYNAVFSNLLGNVLVVDNLDNAILLHKKYHYTTRIVTLEGERLNPGGAMTGGSLNQKQTSIFNRGRVLKELSAQIENLQRDKGALTEMLNNAQKEAEEVQKQISAGDHDLHEKELKKVELHANLTQMTEQAALLDQKAEALDTENMEIDTQLTQADADIFRSGEGLARIKKELTQIQQSLDSYQNISARQREEQQNKANELMNLRVNLGSLEEKMKAMSVVLLQLETEKESSAQEITQFGQEILQKEQLQKEKEQSIEIIQAAMQAITEKQEESKEALQKKEGEKSALYEKIAELEQKELQTIKTISLLENEAVRLEMQSKQADDARRQLFDNLWEEYGLTYQKALEYESLTPGIPEKSVEALKKEEQALKRALQSMGDVNVGAIEEYRAKSIRYQQMTEQRDDILAAEQKLQALIEELTAMMEQQFREQFKLISANFSQVFMKMFGGGKAYLQLADEKNVLTSGIDIIAQPPGKALQSMSLLSGGERALTATALLFGILQLKPTPFCVLDEIESALDDANVKRFSNFVQNFSQDTQFILITHRKGTMEASDILYGVTMQEQGVSKLVSVDFEAV